MMGYAALGGSSFDLIAGNFDIFDDFVRGFAFKGGVVLVPLSNTS
jgi:hypothetical protein